MSPAVDNRTFEAFPNWEKPDQPAFEEHIRLGPIPKVRLRVAPAYHTFQAWRQLLKV